MPVATPVKPKATARKAVVRPATHKPKVVTSAATLMISRKNHSSWSLRGWLTGRFAGLESSEVMVSPSDADARKELMLLAASIRVACLTHDGVKVWNRPSIAPHLNEVKPNAGLMPNERDVQADVCSVRMNSVYAILCASLPMNLRDRSPGHKIWARAGIDVDHVVKLWAGYLSAYGSPFLFGRQGGTAAAPSVRRARHTF